MTVYDYNILKNFKSEIIHLSTLLYGRCDQSCEVKNSKITRFWYDLCANLGKPQKVGFCRYIHFRPM